MIQLRRGGSGLKALLLCLLVVPFVGLPSTARGENAGPPQGVYDGPPQGENHASPQGEVAFNPAVMDSVVSVLPLWPGKERGGTGDLAPGMAPEGTAVAILPGGHLATALHVVERALEITVRLADGRELPATLVGVDRASDLALLRIKTELPVLAVGPEPRLGDPVCAVGNQFGLDLSVTCGVVSGLHRSGIGFNPIEDFLQTDATVNPGSSGGALVDRQGRLVGLLSAIFSKQSDASIGVNFAVSTALLLRVVEDLAAHGQVVLARPGLKFGRLGAEERARTAGVRIERLYPGGAAETAGLAVGDIVSAIDGRPVRNPAAALAALHLKRPGERLSLTVQRDGTARDIEMDLAP